MVFKRIFDIAVFFYKNENLRHSFILRNVLNQKIRQLVMFDSNKAVCKNDFFCIKLKTLFVSKRVD